MLVRASVLQLLRSLPCKAARGVMPQNAYKNTNLLPNKGTFARKSEFSG